MSAITDALVSAGIPGEAASRIAEAIRAHVSDSVRLTASTAPKTSGTSAATVTAVTQATTTEPETIEVQSALYSKGFAKFSGDNVFDGSVSLNGKVNWNGPRRPTDISAVGAIMVQGDNLVLMQKRVAVLNHYGDTPFATMAPLVVLTAVTFDAENCAVVASTTTIRAITIAATSQVP